MTTVDQIIAALDAAGGFQTTAAKKLGITQSALSQRIKKSKKIKNAWLEIQEKYLDLAESKLLTKIRKGSLGAICFYLKCKGKQRGYIEQYQITPLNEDKQQPIKVEIITESGRKKQDSN